MKTATIFTLLFFIHGGLDLGKDRWDKDPFLHDIFNSHLLYEPYRGSSACYSCLKRLYVMTSSLSPF